MSNINKKVHKFLKKNENEDNIISTFQGLKKIFIK